MKRALAWLAGCLLVPSAVLAVSTKSFVIDTSEAFEKGKFEGTASHTRGGSRARVDQAHPHRGRARGVRERRGPRWRDLRGHRQRGAVYRVTRRGRQAVRGHGRRADHLVGVGRTTCSTRAACPEVASLRSTRRAGQGTAKLPDAEHVWALRFDAKKSTLYAATGPEGKLFALDGERQRRSSSTTTTPNTCLCLDHDAQGRLYVGTSNGARLLRVAGEQASVLYDFPGSGAHRARRRARLRGRGLQRVSDAAARRRRHRAKTWAPRACAGPSPAKASSTASASMDSSTSSTARTPRTSARCRSSPPVDAFRSGLAQDGRVVRVATTAIVRYGPTPTSARWSPSTSVARRRTS